MSEFLQVVNLNKHYDNEPVLAQLNFSMKEGEVLSVLGASGTGKVTLLRVLAGLEPCSAGDIILEGKDVTNMDSTIRPVGIMFEEPYLFPNMNVLDNVLYGMTFNEEDKEYKIFKAKKYLVRAGLEEYTESKIADLNSEQQKRVSFIRTLFIKPKLLLIDKPSTNVESKSKKLYISWLKEMIKEENITTILITNDIAEAIEMGDRLAILNKGKFDQIGEYEELFFNPATRLVASFFSQVLILPNN